MSFKHYRNLFIYILLGCIISYFLWDYYHRKETFQTFDDPKIQQLIDKLSVTFPELKNHISANASNRSFTINKKDIYLCTKDEHGAYYPDNMLVYVLLHELAHTMCDEVGHTEKYKSIFRSLLVRAQKNNLYDPNIPPIDNYCEY